MAVGDILSCTVRADGWSADVVVEGFTTGATYGFGSLASSPATTSSPKFTMTVTSEGYNSSGVLGTVVRTVYGTKVVRKAYPDQATADETGGGNLTVRVALSESVYNDDKAGGAGTSGTNPTVTIAAGWCVNAGGASQSSVVATNLAVTNNSTLDYPKVIAQWAWGHTPAFRRVSTAFDIGCIAYHGHGIACVALSATNGTTKLGTVTAKTKHLMSASGLYYESYDFNVSLSGWSEADITLKYIAYPTIGDADSIIDTSTDTSTANIAKGLTQITATYKTTSVVTVTAGTGGTYATIGAALASSPDIILVKSNIDLLGSTPASVTAKSYCIEVMPETGSFTLTRNGLSGYDFKARHLRYSGFTVASAGEAFSLESTAAYTLQFADCTFTRTGALPGQGIGAETDATLFVNSTWDGRDNFGLGAIYNNSMIGCNVIGGRFQTFHGLIANKITGNGVADETFVEQRLAGLSQSNFMCVNNKMLALKNTSSYSVSFGDDAGIVGSVFIGNIVEVITGTLPTVGWFDGTTNQTCDSSIFAHNTLIGERLNINYNDAGVAAVLQTNIFVRNNACHSYNIKSDVFAPANANRIGNWASLHGVNYSDNRYDGSLGFSGDWDGINVSYVNAEDTTYGQLGYTDDNSKDGDATGNGDYTPTASSPLKGHTLRQSYLSFDLAGNPINREIGAIQLLSSRRRLPLRMWLH